jgi:pyocin large subunit-like protein
MADFVFNYGKGRVAEFYNRVDSNDPANSALIIVILKTAGLESDATLKDYANLDLLLKRGGGSQVGEVTNSGYARKTLTDTDLSALSVDTGNDRVDLDFADQTWTAVGAGDGWSKLLVCYDNDTTAGNDTNIIPLTAHDFVVTPDGSDITATVAGFFRAS